MIGNQIKYMKNSTLTKGRVIDKILVAEELSKKKTRGEGAYGSGFASSTRYLVCDADKDTVSIIRPDCIVNVL
jgi:hypothetical protein